MNDKHSQHAKTAPRKKSNRRQTIVFVSVFVFSVLILLTGYRYTVNTRANDWYLFQVARHTTWALDHIGYSCSLEEESPNSPSPKEQRASLAALKRGEKKTTPEDLAAASDAPLSAWERFSFRLIRARLLDIKTTFGPRVAFVLTPGLLETIKNKEAVLLSLKDNLRPEAIRKRLKLQEEVDLLRKEINDPETPKKEKRKRLGKSFGFIIVAECGAIEVMVIFFAAVLAFPTRFKHKAIGFLFGLPVMYLLNIVRLSCLAVIGALTNGGPWFDFAHHYVWQSIYIIFIVIVWLVWVETVVRGKST